MSKLSDMFKTMRKKDGSIVRELDKYLMTLSAKDDNRAIDVNAPSQVGGCLRARYYSRIGLPSDESSISPRTKRIFDNGSYVHIRLQGYMRDFGLIHEEVPVHNEEYNIHGHTDGIFKFSETDYAVIEIKSINDRGFIALAGAKEEHKQQGLIYLYCLETRRQFLQSYYDNVKKFERCFVEREEWYEKFYQHLESGSTFTKEEKIGYQVKQCLLIDSVLYSMTKPLERVVFLYENKNDQEIKEFTVSSKDKMSEKILEDILAECSLLNKMVLQKRVPMRPAGDKNDFNCRYCNYKITCWG